MPPGSVALTACLRGDTTPRPKKTRAALLLPGANLAACAVRARHPCLQRAGYNLLLGRFRRYRPRTKLQRNSSPPRSLENVFQAGRGRTSARRKARASHFLPGVESQPFPQRTSPLNSIELRQRDARKPLDLTQVPLFRAKLI